MKAGFARKIINPPPGTRMMGFGTRDRDHGCERVHDDIFVRALYLAHEAEQALIMAFDLCFLDREVADRLKGAIGRRLDLSPRQVLFNFSHTHSGPDTHRWAYGDFLEPERLYLRELEAATVAAALEAHQAARDVSLWAGMTRTAVPMSRRKKLPDGTISFAPAPDRPICDALPLCLFKDATGKPVCLLFSISCHPSTVVGFEISADFPGVAADRLDAHLGRPVSLFLQGAGGDAKACVIGDQPDRWRRGNWDDVARAGEMLANEVIQALDADLKPVEPQLRAYSIEMEWPLETPLTRAGYQAIADAPTQDELNLKRLWAKRQVELLDRGQALPRTAVITTHGIQLGKGVRMVGLEGEAVAELGDLIIDFYGEGVTFPMGYTDGTQLYLPTSAMLDEGGYEADSFHEYGFPSRFVKGVEDILRQTLADLQTRGIR
jgi:hypothetical protein